MAAGSISLLPHNARFGTANIPKLNTIAGTNMPVPVIEFDATNDLAMYFTLDPAGYTSGNCTLKIRWGAASATSNDVLWESAVLAYTPDTDSTAFDAKSFATAQTVADTHLGTTAGRMMVATITVSNLDSMADGDHVVLRIRRLGSSGSDTMTGNAYFFSASFAWT